MSLTMPFYNPLANASNNQIPISKPFPMSLLLSTSDALLLTLLGGLAVYWVFGSKIFGSKSNDELVALTKAPCNNENGSAVGNDRDFVERMNTQKKKAIIFYGSQTGTAEDYATRIAKEAKSRFGISSLVADPEDYDFEHLDKLNEDQIAFFVMATYGEGEPTDNAATMCEFLGDASNEFSQGGDLSNLKYVIFALGNKTYEMFCEVGKNVDKHLSSRGAKLVGTVGFGDDDKSMEEDYLAWKDDMWAAVQQEMGWEEGAGGDIPDFEVKEKTEFDEARVYRGELSARALAGTRGVFDAKNPCPASVVVARELFSDGDRNCMHMEIDIADTGIRYQTGDHLGVWPLNPDSEVARLMKLLNLWEKRETVIDVTSLDPALAKVPFPTPSSYDAIFRHYLDISAPVSRQLLSTLSKFAPTPQAAAVLERLGNDKDAYAAEVGEKCLKLGEALLMAAGESYRIDPLSNNWNPTHVWPIPFDRIISGLPRLQPRYYSISSSPKLSPDKIHITAVVLKYDAGDQRVYGCSTNYLLNMKMAIHGEVERLQHQPIDHRHDGAPRYKLEGPRSRYFQGNQYRVPVHVRRSNFRLPTSPKIPVVMIGPGTGVAPFRAFVQERVALARKAKEKDGPNALDSWGNISLYYGCRHDGDWLYKDEWEGYVNELNGKFKMYTALSRAPGQPKEHVQKKIEETATSIASDILDKKGFLYICGDAKHMAKDVEERLKNIFGRHTGGGMTQGAAEMKLLKDRNRMLLDVWS